MAVLYQKYRPQKFSEIFGQNHIKATLQNEISREKISHAYLFCGPRAVGKTTLARVFAKAVNCENRADKDFEPCNECNTCKSINSFSNLDVIEVDAASNTGVDNVRENIISLSRVKSSNNKYKVFIIDEVHMLSTQAFNALLKTLEEPPANVIFILCTTEIYKVPLTIISRCERFDFRKISVSDMIGKLETITKSEKLDVEREVLELIALKSEGHLRDAESLLSQVIAVSGDKIDVASATLVIPYNNLEENIKLLEYIGKKDVVSAIKSVNDLTVNGISLKNFLNDLVELLRKMILSKLNDSLSTLLGLDLSEKIEIKISELNRQFSLNDLVKITEEFMSVSKELSSALIAQLPLELAIINLCQGAEIKIKNDIVSEIKKEKIVEVEAAEETKEKIEEMEVKEIIVEKIIKTDKNISSSKTIISVSDIESHWSEFITKLKPHNHSLFSVLQSCKVNAVDGQMVCLSFKYKFHKDRLDNPDMKKIVEEVLRDIFQTDLKVQTSVDKDLEINNKSNNKNNEVIDNLLKNFGGQVIN